MKNNRVLEALHHALQFTTGHVVLVNEEENYYTVAFESAQERFTVRYKGTGAAFAWKGDYSEWADADLFKAQHNVNVSPFDSGDDGTCKWLLAVVLFCAPRHCTPVHLRKPSHAAVCRFLRSIDSLPTKNIGGLAFVGTAAIMAADALEGRPDDWVNETTREQRVAILYGVFAASTFGLKNEEVVEAIRALEALEPAETTEAAQSQAEWKTTCAVFVESLAKDKDVIVREVVAKRLPIDSPLLAEMAKDERAAVRKVVAERLPPDHPLLAALAKDEDWRVREAAAKRLTVDHPLLAALAKDEDCDVREAATERLKEKP